MTAQNRITLQFFVPAPLARFPAIVAGVWNAVLTALAIVLVVIGVVRLRRVSMTPGA